MRTALLSVYRKDGIVEFAQALVGCGFTIYASGGTFDHLTENGVAALPVSGLVGGEAILGHRVVTLSREIHAGLLARHDEPEDRAELAKLGIPIIHLVCVDLYPLESEINKPGATRDSVVEMTDIGGPTLLRSAAKGRRIVICDLADRERVIECMREGEFPDFLIDDLCAKAEVTVTRYCAASAQFLSGGRFRARFYEE